MAASVFHQTSTDQLMLPENYPRDVVEFLDAERSLLATLLPAKGLLVEAACNDGRYLDLAAQYDIGYLGVDLVQRHVDAGRRRVAQLGLAPRRCRFVVGDAAALDEVLDPSALPEGCVAVFPFCILSALESPDRLAEALASLRVSFVVTNYDPTDAATAIRLAYYRRCGYREVTVRDTEDGVWLHTADGLSTVAYRRETLRRLWHRHGIDAVPVELSVLGSAWVRAV